MSTQELEEKMEHKSYLYKQGSGWVVCHWDSSVDCYRCSGEMSYGIARQAIGAANCPHADDGQCGKTTHGHPTTARPDAEIAALVRSYGLPYRGSR